MPRSLLAAALALSATAACAFTAACASSSTPAPTPAPAIALVFDTGADAGHTAAILSVLRDEKVRGSFVVTGLWAEQHRDLLLAIAAGGHQIINGGYHGTSFTGASTGTPPLTAAERTLELSRTEVTVYHLTGRTTRPYWRPPHADIDDGARRDAAAAGYLDVVLPTLDTATTPGATADDIVTRLEAVAAPGAIELLHASSVRDAEALPQIIRALRASGISFAASEDLTRP